MFTGWLQWFLICYFNDILAGVFIVAVVDLYFLMVHLRRLTAKEMVMLLFFCGVIWEGFAPMLKPTAVFDWWDFIAYQVGGLVYTIAHKFCYFGKRGERHMICFHCGKEIADGSKFCPHCGKATAINAEPILPTTTEDKPLPDDVVEISSVPQSDTGAADTNTFTGQEAQAPQINKFEPILHKNVQYYAVEFEKIAHEQKTKFNWAAFLFSACFCFYRKCPELFVKYFLLPVGINLAGIAVSSIGLTIMSQNVILAGGAILLVGSIYGFINAIRFGKKFNAEYYHHCLSVLESNDTKKYGTSVGSVALFVVVITVISILTSLPYQLSDNNPARWGGAPTPGLAKAWGLMDSPEEPIGTFDLLPNEYYTEMDAYDYSDLIAVLSDYGTAKAFWEKYSGSGTRLCIYNVRLETHDEISVYDPTELLRFIPSDETTEGKIFHTNYDYMIIGSMHIFSSVDDYSYHQVELNECEIYDNYDESQFMAEGQNNFYSSNIDYADFVGEFDGSEEDDALWINWSDTDLEISCYGYRAEYFNATVNTTQMLSGNTLKFQANDPYSNSTYNVSLTYTPAEESSYGADTIYMEADGLFDMVYTRHVESPYAEPETLLTFDPEPAFDGMPTFSYDKLSYGVADFCAAYEGQRVRIYGLTFYSGTYDADRRTLIDDDNYVVLMDHTIDDHISSGEYNSFGSDVVVEGDVTGYLDYDSFEALCLDNTLISLNLTDYWVDGNYATGP